jgi:lysyl-tRNA synthetase class 2
VAYGPDGRVQAFARFAVCGGGRVLTLDIAPRRPDASNGVVERLIIEVLEYGRTVGAREVSLNFAGLRRMFEVRGPMAPVVRTVTHAFDRWIELGSLYRFCAKFQPTWRPRSLLVRSWLEFGQVTAACMAAEFGDRPVPAAGPVWIPSQQSVEVVERLPGTAPASSAADER